MPLESSLILTDEAVSTLGAPLRVNLMDPLFELQKMFSASFVSISHDIANARYLAGRTDGRITAMYPGRIIEVDPADEVIKNPQYPYTKSLLWATSGLSKMNDPIETPSVGRIDIPDPENPPSGCRFYTHCPEVREYCTSNTPDPSGMSGPSDRHEAVCFDVHNRVDYRSSEPVTDGLDINVADGAEQPAD